MLRCGGRGHLITELPAYSRTRWIFYWIVLDAGMNAPRAVRVVCHRLGTAFEPPWTVVLRGSVHAVQFIPRLTLAALA